MSMIGIGIGVAMSPPAFAQAADPQAGIAALLASGGDAWTLDEAAGNFTGSANAVVATRNGALSQDPDPMVGDATYSDDSSQFITIPPANTPFFAGEPFSIAFWLKFVATANIGNASIATISAYTDDYDILNFQLSGGLNPGAIAFSMFSVEYETATCTLDLSTVRPPTQDEYVFVVLTHDGAGGIAIDVNAGALTDSAQITPGSTYDFSGSANPLVFMAKGVNGSLPNNRDIQVSFDELLIVPGVLTAGQIAWLYNSGAGRSMSVFA